MPTLHVLSGLPASGKTTAALAMVKEYKGGLKRVSLDDLHAMLEGAPDKNRRNTNAGREFAKTVRGISDGLILGLLEEGYDVVADNLHLASKYRDHYEKLVAEYAPLNGKEVEVIHKFFDVSLEECLARDKSRGEKSVGHKVIQEMYAKHLWQPPAVPPFDPKLEDAVVFDIDGTLALMGPRSPFEWHKVGLDIVNAPVREALMAHKRDGKFIIIMSGRDGVCRPETEKWLSDNFIEYHTLLMRAEKDNRKDDIVKKELYEANVKGLYNVRAWYDDREQVVRMVRVELGLPCFQVNPGNF